MPVGRDDELRTGPGRVTRRGWKPPQAGNPQWTLVISLSFEDIAAACRRGSNVPCRVPGSP